MLRRCLPPPPGRPTPLVPFGLEFSLWFIAALSVMTWWESMMNQFSERGADGEWAAAATRAVLQCAVVSFSAGTPSVLSSEASGTFTLVPP